MKTLFIFIGNRINASDTLWTRFIHELSQRYYTVVFLPTDIGGAKPDTSAYPKNENISYHLIEAPMGRFWTFFHEIRDELLTRFDALFDAQWQKKIHKKRRNPRLFLWRVIAKIFPTQFLTTEFFTKIEILLVPGFSRFKKYAQKYQPEIVLVSFSGNNPLEIFATLWARRSGIRTIMYNPTWDKFTSDTKHIRNTDYVITWNEQSKEQAIELGGYSPDKVFIGGALRFDHYFRDESLPVSREEFLKSKGLDPTRKTIFFASQCHKTFHIDFIRSFISWNRNGLFDRPLNLFVRPHTLDSMEDYRQFSRIPGVCVERAGILKQSEMVSGHKTEMNESDLIDTKMLLKYCDVCVTVNSTMSVEAMVFDRPVVCAGFVPLYSEAIYCESYYPVVRCGAVRIAASMDEMRDLIQSYLTNPAADREGRKCAVKFAMGPTDGYSYKRIADLVDGILKYETNK